jgi:7-keto-8-aminopelargonate synthetase-like enzyme
MTWENQRTLMVTRQLLDEGVFVNPVIPPGVPEGQCMLRTSYTPTHTKEQLEFALNAFHIVFNSSV